MFWFGCESEGLLVAIFVFPSITGLSVHVLGTVIFLFLDGIRIRVFKRWQFINAKNQFRDPITVCFSASSASSLFNPRG